MTLYATQRKQYVCWLDQSNHRVGTQQESGSEIRNLALSRSIVTQDIWLQTVEMIRILKKQFMRQNALGYMMVRKFSFAPLEVKFNCSSHIFTPYMDVLFGVIHTRTQLENLNVSVIVTHSSVLLTSPDTPARVWHFWPYQCGVPQICLQREEQSSSLPQQYCYCHCQYNHISSGSADSKWESIINFINHRYNYLSIFQCVINDFVTN